jgi:hypothetical protein
MRYRKALLYGLLASLLISSAACNPDDDQSATGTSAGSSKVGSDTDSTCQDRPKPTTAPDLFEPSNPYFTIGELEGVLDTTVYSADGNGSSIEWFADAQYTYGAGIPHPTCPEQEVNNYAILMIIASDTKARDKDNGGTKLWKKYEDYPRLDGYGVRAYGDDQLLVLTKNGDTVIINFMPGGKPNPQTPARMKALGQLVAAKL